MLTNGRASFYFHILDQVALPDTFSRFMVTDVMYDHWNNTPHRLGWFGVDERVRPQYFVYQMLTRMGNERLKAETAGCDSSVRAAAARSEGKVSVLATNYTTLSNQGKVLIMHFTNLKPDYKRVVVYRIDEKMNWDPEKLELIPVENRITYAKQEFTCQVYLPEDSVVKVDLVDA